MNITVTDIEFVKELYPRLREDDGAIERYRAAIDRLPPITVARGRVLVDGFHRWQAHRREGSTEIEVEDLGDLTDIEIFKESIRRNSRHGHQLATTDKRRGADLLYRQGTRDIDEIAELLSVARTTAETYVRDARRDEKADQKTRAWDLWLDCLSYREVANHIGIDHKTVAEWCGEKADESGNSPPDSRQHFDVWNFHTATGDSSYFGKMPPQIVENLLWLYTEPGQVVFDPFVGGGTTIDVAKAMGRRVWASDRKPSTPTLPIHEHDIAEGWPKKAPKKADFILLDPPYWRQAAGRYSSDITDLGNMTLDDFYATLGKFLEVCQQHLTDDGRLAYIVSPAEVKDENKVIDLAFGIHVVCQQAGLSNDRRIIATYNTQQATGQQVEWARDHRKLLKLYRDIVVMSK